MEKLIEIMNNFLDLGYLTTDFMNFIKNFSYYLTITISLLIIFALIYTIFENKDIKVFQLIFGLITIIIAMIALLVFIILAISLITLPGLCLCSVIKYYIVQSEMSLITNLIINLISIFIGSAIYGFIAQKLITNAV